LVEKAAFLLIRLALGYLFAGQHLTARNVQPFLGLHLSNAKIIPGICGKMVDFLKVIQPRRLGDA
jgi:hypothetical protein